MAEIADRSIPITKEQWNLVNPFNKNITEEFLRESVNLSPKTLIQYESSLHIFFNYIREFAFNKKLTEIKSRDFLLYQNFLTRKGLSSSAIRLKRAGVSSLNGYVLTYYEEEFPLFKNFITKKITAPTQVFVHDKVPLTPEEFDHLIKTLEDMEEWEKIAYLKFTYSTGCRRAESRQLLSEVINYPLIEKKRKIKNEDGIEEEKDAKYYITHDIRCKGASKIGKVRKMKYDIDAMESIKKWLEVRGEVDCPYVFTCKYNGVVKQVSESTFNDWCSGLFTEIVGRRVHCHLLRESRATNMVLFEGKDIKIAQKLLGHLSSTTTEIYVIRDEEEDSDDAFIE
jgi:site-specific recombinase XerD